jgi:hypothetical protein
MIAPWAKEAESSLVNSWCLHPDSETKKAGEWQGVPDGDQA